MKINVFTCISLIKNKKKKNDLDQEFRPTGL